MQSGHDLRGQSLEDIAKLYCSGQSMSEISKQIGLSAATISRRLEQGGFKKRARKEINQARYASHPRAPKINRKLAASLYVTGMTIKEVATQLGVAMVTVQKALRAEGVATRPRGSGRDGQFTRHITRNGYATIRTGVGKRRGEHIILAERVLGRELRKNEVVHHINGDRSDNRNSNLIICDKGYHSSLHWKMTKIQRKEMNNELAKPTVGLDNTEKYQRRFDG